MKVMIRMLASILPGIIVGLGVIAYLERENLQERWAMYAGGGEVRPHIDSKSGYETQPYLRKPERTISPPRNPSQHERRGELAEPLQSVQSKQLTPNTAFVVEAEPAPLQKREEETQQPVILDRVVKATESVKPSVKLNEQQEVAAVSVQRPLPDLSELVGLTSPAQNSNTAELPKAVEQSKQSSLSQIIEQEQMLSQIFDDLPELQEQIASLSKPIEALAKQFNPIGKSAVSDRPQPNGKKGGEDIWRMDAVPEVETQPQWLWNQGRQAFWEGDYDRAIESYRSLLQEEPKNPDAWGELGNIYYAKKDWVRAVRAFGRAAASLTHQGRDTEAEKIMTVIRGIDPQLAERLTQERLTPDLP